MKNLVIVESPTKARTVKRFLPKQFIVEASIGHVRDLPQNASEIPASKKTLDWANLGIDVENNFAPLYIIPKGKTKIINSLKRIMKQVDTLYLATDEDREGESISWHLVQLLSPEKYKIPVRRMVFHEITKKAIMESLENTREIDMNLVQAQETRRILDRLYGYTISPLLWKKIAFRLSAGRVQSPGLRLIVDRERKRIEFIQSEFYDLEAELSSPSSNIIFKAVLVALDGSPLAGGKDFDPKTGKVKNRTVIVLNKTDAEKLIEPLKSAEWKITDIQEKPYSSNPPIPFITSTLQQESNKKLGLSARETMRTAQRLYEEGLITYMRSDSPTLSSEAIGASRKAIEELFGKNYLSKSPRQFSSASKTAQEAHEAIRPAGSQFRHPDELELSGREAQLYTLIWNRTLASQMAKAEKLTTTAKISAGNAIFQVSGTTIVFPGYLRVYKDSGNKEDAENHVPSLELGEVCKLHSLNLSHHETRPPARYTEASLIQNLEKLGIGRPSTYSNIIGTLFDRSYIRKVKGSLVPSYVAMAVIQLLENNFAYLVEYTFTSNMEDSLDEIASGKQDSIVYLKQFYKGKKGLKEQVNQRELGISSEESRRINLPQITSGVEIRIGRFGPYIVAQGPNGEKINATISEDIPPAELSNSALQAIIDIQLRGPEPIGLDPKTSQPIFCLNGRYGFYLQLGETTEENPKPRRASLPKNISPSELSLEEALKYLSIPRVLGKHPQTGEEVTAAIGRFGPFVVHQGDFRSLRQGDDVYSISLDRALELLAEEKKSGYQRRQSQLLREIGEFNNKKIAIYVGKYGPYVKFGSKNIPLPEGKKTDEAISQLSLKEAKEIIKVSLGNRS